MVQILNNKGIFYMTDYQVLCICITLVVIVVIICVSFVIREWIDSKQHLLLSKGDYNYINSRLDMVEGCIKALLKRNSEL